MRRLLPPLVLIATFATSCHSVTTYVDYAPTPSVSTSLGVFANTDARAMMAGICALERGAADLKQANTIFYEQVHARLHILAAAEAAKDRGAAGTLLRTKERVEADLAEKSLPTTFLDDMAALEGKARAALRTIGFPDLGCNA